MFVDVVTQNSQFPHVFTWLWSLLFISCFLSVQQQLPLVVQLLQRQPIPQGSPQPMSCALWLCPESPTASDIYTARDLGLRSSGEPLYLQLQSLSINICL